MTISFTVPNWRPTSINALLRCHWATRSRLKKKDVEMVGFYWLAARLPRAAGKRSVTVTLATPPGETQPDADNVLKVLLDALVRCGALIDDGPDYLGSVTVCHERGDKRETRISLEDLPCPNVPEK